MRNPNRRRSVRLRGRGRRPFADDELRRLLNAAEGEWKGMILFSLYVGLRLRDVALLEHKHIDRALINLIVHSADKQSQKRPIPPTLWRYIESLPTPYDMQQPMFPDAFASANAGKLRQLRTEFAQLLLELGLKLKPAGAGQHRVDRYLPLSFECLRYNYVMMLRRIHIPKEIAAQLCGHRSMEISTHVREFNLHKVVEGLPDILGSRTTN